jgi:hypothetical protein
MNPTSPKYPLPTKACLSLGCEVLRAVAPRIATLPLEEVAKISLVAWQPEIASLFASSRAERQLLRATGASLKLVWEWSEVAQPFGKRSRKHAGCIDARCRLIVQRCDEALTVYGPTLIAKMPEIAAKKAASTLSETSALNDKLEKTRPIGFSKPLRKSRSRGQELISELKAAVRIAAELKLTETEQRLSAELAAVEKLVLAIAASGKKSDA